MERKAKVGIVCCSNGQAASYKNDIQSLSKLLVDLGLIPVFSDYIYENESVFSGTARQRAEALMNLYLDDEIAAIYDISGGDIANELLPYLDYDVIARSNKQFWGYSDLTTIINAMYAKSSAKSVLYQIKNLVWDDSGEQLRRFVNHLSGNQNDLYSFKYEFVQGSCLDGIVVGGNIRCLLKLAGTEYFPDMHDKVLLLEARSGNVPQMVTYLNQLKQMRVFDKINGILLGTFTAMEIEKSTLTIAALVREYAGCDIPIIKSYEIGHGRDSKAIVIGEELHLRKN